MPELASVVVTVWSYRMAFVTVQVTVDVCKVGAVSAAVMGPVLVACAVTGAAAGATGYCCYKYFE